MMRSETESWTVLATKVEVTDDRLTFELNDGRTISAPLAWYPRLLHGTPKERSHWEIGSGVGVHWPDLDEDISVENLLRGSPSGESERSFRRWLEERSAGKAQEPASKNLGAARA
jgi:hypothetical protein